MPSSTNYQQGVDMPELIDFCTNCKKLICDGECAEFKDKWREVFGFAPIRRKKRTPRSVHHGEIQIEYDGETQNLSWWAKKTGTCYDTLYKRWRLGWTEQAILETPLLRPPTRKKRRKSDGSQVHLLARRAGEDAFQASDLGDDGKARSPIEAAEREATA